MILEKMKTKNSLLVTLISVLVLISLFLFLQGQSHSNISKSTPLEKHKGAHYFARVDSSFSDPLEEHNIEWVAWVSWAYQDDFNTPELTHHNGDSTMIKETNASWVNDVKTIRQQGYKVFIKPHIWLRKPTDGKWRSQITFDNDADWNKWQNDYRDFILRYAMLSEQAGAEMFCIGTELSEVTIQKPEFWRKLIRDIRKIYSGSITYGANWYKEYEDITFWDDLDFIGVQAYFPLTENESPSLEQIEKGWQKYLPDLENLAIRFDKKILFTELGYRSTMKGASEPWLWIEKSCNDDKHYSPETQALSYEAFFNQVWPKEWFGGVHLWKLKDFKPIEGRIDLNFTPRGKPASKIIANRFSN